MVMTSLSRLNLSVTLLRLEICWSCFSITRLISFISRLKYCQHSLSGYTCDILTHLRSVTAFSRLGPLARGVRGPGLDSTSLEQSSSSEQRLKRLMSPGLQYGCGDSSPAQLPGINHNLYNSPPPLPYLQTQS